MKELNQKLAIVQTKLKAKKSSYNAFGKYYFRKAEDILEAIKPFLLEQGITLDQMVQISKEQGKKTPKIISDMMKKQGLKSSNNKNSGENNSKKKTSKLDKYPSMMNITKYKDYQKLKLIN